MGEQPIDLLIEGGIILPMDSSNVRISDGWVAVDKGIIIGVAATGDNLPWHPKERIDARDCIVMPGLVNTHTHMPMTLFRGLADDLPLDVWLNEYMFPAEADHITPETVGPATRLACAEMLLSGTTTCCDGYFHEDEVAEAAAESGIRSVLAQGVIDFPAPGVPDPSKNVDHAVSFVEKWQGKHCRISPSVFCHSPYTCSDNTLIRAKEVADERQILFQIHAAETRAEYDQSKAAKGASPIEYLNRLGLLNTNTLLVHAVWVDEKDIELISKKGAHISVTTESEMKLASGIAPVPRFIESGIPLGIGTDGCASNNDLDLFQEMDTTAKLHKVNMGDSSVMGAQTVLRAATIGGAKAIGLGEQIGSLEVGKLADVIIVDTRKPHLTPMYSEISHLVYTVRGADVRDVFVSGEQLVRDGRLLSLDLECIIDEVAAIGAKIQSTGR